MKKISFFYCVIQRFSYVIRIKTLKINIQKKYSFFACSCFQRQDKKFNKFNFQDLNLAYIYNCVLNDMKKKFEKK